MKNILKEKPEVYENLHGRLKKSCDQIKDLEGKAILDVGCGFGWFLDYSIKQKASRVVGIETEELPVVNGAEILAASVFKLPFNYNEFDIITMFDIIEHLPKGSELKALCEINRVLKPDGKVYITVPYRSFRATLFDPAWLLIGHRHYNEETLLKLLSMSGFSNVSFSVHGAKWDLLGILNLYISKWVLRRMPIFKSFFDKKTDEEYCKNGYMTLFINASK